MFHSVLAFSRQFMPRLKFTGIQVDFLDRLSNELC